MSDNLFSNILLHIYAELLPRFSEKRRPWHNELHCGSVQYGNHRRRSTLRLPEGGSHRQQWLSEIFLCQRRETTDSFTFLFFLFAGKVHVARRCQVRLPANESCVHFTRAIGVEREYRNATCSICSEDSCNAAQKVQVWSMFLAPTLLLTGFFMLFA